MRQFSVDEYHRMIHAGLFGKGERLELLDGFIVEKMPHDPIHDAAIAYARKLLAGLLPEGFHLRVQSAITLAESEPEPDLVVVVGDELDYASRHPSPSDIPLVIEASNSSLSEDRGWMSQIYARNGIANYWILDLVHFRLEARTDPSGTPVDAVYRNVQVLELGQSATLAIGQARLSIAVEAMIPARLRQRGN